MNTNTLKLRLLIGNIINLFYLRNKFCFLSVIFQYVKRYRQLNKMNLIFLLLIVILNIYLVVDCVPCESPFKCLSFVTNKDCEEGQILEYNPQKSCCPVCRGGLGQ